MEITELTTAQDAAYDAALRGFPSRSIYHTAAWREFLAEAFGARPFTLVAWRAAEVVGSMPLAAVRTIFGGWRVASLPYSHHVPPLGADEVAALLINRAVELARARYGCDLELRGGVSHPTASVVATSVSVSPEFDIMRQRLDRKTRNQLVQAERDDRMTIRAAASDADYAAMDYIMAVNRRQLGSATYARRVFQILKARAGSSILAALACHNQTPIAFMITSSVGQSAIFHYGASLPRYRGARPNNLLMWNALCWAATQGARAVDLGTSLPSQTGLIHFKEGWGGTSAALSYVKIRADGTRWVPASTQEGPAARAAGWLLRRAPLGLFRRITPPLVRAFG